MRYNIPPHEVAWHAFRRAETHEPHAPLRMLSCQSRSTPYMWNCPILKCGNYTYTYVASDPAPVCYGGAGWSFQTQSPPEYDG